MTPSGSCPRSLTCIDFLLSSVVYLQHSTLPSIHPFVSAVSTVQSTLFGSVLGLVPYLCQCPLSLSLPSSVGTSPELDCTGLDGGFILALPPPLFVPPTRFSSFLFLLPTVPTVPTSSIIRYGLSLSLPSFSSTSTSNPRPVFKHPSSRGSIIYPSSTNLAPHAQGKHP